ncbi:AAA family ATPase [Actinoplanes sp. NPDC051861]|uniref:NACHT domain-containing protein n=1 Tax=Actinoplanes sp. NPDC051861 TaxID=3155170 RepID=UPI00341B3A86
MARSRLSYAEAVRTLTGGDDRVALLSRVAGGALLVAAPFVPGVLSWFDAKGEANTLLRDLVGAAPTRIRASRGRRHYELIEAAHTVLVLSSFFDAVAEEAGEERFTALELTDDEKRHIARLPREHFGSAAPPMPGALTGFRENLPAVERALAQMGGVFSDFIGGLAAGRGVHSMSSGPSVARALAIYQERYVRLAADVPEFAIWSQLDEHAATRAEVRGQSETLTELAGLLHGLVDMPTPAGDAVRALERHHVQGLQKLLWRSDTPAPDGLRFPTVEAGFISPRFRLAVHDKDARLGDESWWHGREVRDGLDAFMAAYLADPESAHQPLIILGHPGAGKSLLTEVLAARLPTEAFTTIRVPLRRVNPDAPVYQQAEAAIEQITKERITWGDLRRAADTTKVVLLDGFDELVQATGVTQSHYVDSAAAFQREEWDQERPVVVVITSRTLVMDRTVVRDGTLVVKLEPFKEAQVDRWTAVWNRVNRDEPTFRPLTTAELWRHRQLAQQPLLLVMLAVYAAGAGDLAAADLSTDQLYRRLLDEFIRRQVREKARAHLGETEFRKLERSSRRDLATVAFAMFNRKRQFVSEKDLEADLDALHPQERRDAGPGEPVSRAQGTAGAFFFVHVAQTDDPARSSGRRSYEFLHATFAEYLVAERTVELLSSVVAHWRLSREDSTGAAPDDRLLRAVLSHQPLTNGEQVISFLQQMITSRTAEDTAAFAEVCLELFRTVRRRADDDAYRPTPFDVVNRSAAYSANLVLLAMLCRPAGVDIGELRGADGPGIESAVRLWRSGLDDEVQKSFFQQLHRRDELLVLGAAQSAPVELTQSVLTGDILLESVLRSGWATFHTDKSGEFYRETITPFQRDFHQRVVGLIAWRWPASAMGRMAPYDEEFYRTLLGWLETSGPVEPLVVSRSLLAKCVLQDLPHLDPGTVRRIVREALLPGEKPSGHDGMAIAVLALTYPHLLAEFPGLRPVVDAAGEPAFLHEVARTHRDRDPAQLDPIIESLREKARGEIGIATPSMVTGLRPSADDLNRILIDISSYGDLSWSQIRPSDLLDAVTAAGTMTSGRKRFEDFINFWQGHGCDDSQAGALARLRAMLDEGRD